jgi:hypothetical protein
VAYRNPAAVRSLPGHREEDDHRRDERDDAGDRGAFRRAVPTSPTMIRIRATMIVRAVGAKFVLRIG